MTEWRPVLGFEGYYEVSSAGEVRSVDRRVQYSDGHWQTATGRALVQGIKKRTGYRVVSLYRGNRGHTRSVHRLVLEAFVGARPHGLEARHADGNPANNAATNLSWGTHLENMRDTVRHRTHRNGNKTRCKNGHDFTPENTIIRPNRGGRDCRACQRVWRADFNTRRSAAEMGAA